MTGFGLIQSAGLHLGFQRSVRGELNGTEEAAHEENKEDTGISHCRGPQRPAAATDMGPLMKFLS